MSSEARIRRARALVGTPFRLHGRDPASGLDCVGLIAIAIRREALAPTGYALRGGTAAGWRVLLDAVASRRRGAARAGDILLMQAGPAQFHLGIWTGPGLIHSDARLRRVVETPGDPQWPVLGAWSRTRGKR
jgi:murein DD-endopeptidase / murein LD-carboxypeptidase